MTTLYLRLRELEGASQRENSPLKSRLIGALVPYGGDYEERTQPRKYLNRKDIPDTPTGLSHGIENFLMEKDVRIPDNVARKEEDKYFWEKLMLSFSNTSEHKSEQQVSYNSGEPLRRIVYGMMRGEDVPSEIYREMEEWVAVYFLAGIFIRSSTSIKGCEFQREKLEKQHVADIVFQTIGKGMNYLSPYFTGSKADKMPPHYDEIRKALGLPEKTWVKRKRKKGRRPSEQLNLL